MTLSEFLVPSYVQMLGALSAWLGKAQQQLDADRADSILQARLAPDMFPLFTQICFACVQAQEGVYRLRQEDFPEAVAALLEEGRSGDATSLTIADARARIAETLAIVEKASGHMPDLPADSPLAHALPMGIVFDFTAEQYVRDWAIPQFFFHVMAAYAILRAEGVQLGKADYVAHLFSCVRPGTMPSPA